MRILPTSVPYTYASSAGALTAPIATAQPGTAEYDAKTLFSLGLLANARATGYAPTDPNSAAGSEVSFLIQSILGNLSNCSPQVRTIIGNSYYYYAGLAGDSTFLDTYMNPNNGTAIQIINWLSGQNPGTTAYDIQTSTDPDTLYYYLMFASSLTIPGMPSNLRTIGDSFFSGTSGGELNMSQWASFFMGVYCNGNPWLGQYLPSFIAPSQSGTTNYNNFLSGWESGTSPYNYTKFGPDPQVNPDLIAGELHIAMINLRGLLPTISLS